MADQPPTPPTSEQLMTALLAKLDTLASTAPAAAPTSSPAPAPAATSVPAAAPAIDYAQLAAAIAKAQSTPAPAAAPAAPSAHTLPTSMGIVDLFNCTPEVLHKQIGPQGVRENLEKAWAQAANASGAPQRPLPPEGFSRGRGR